MTDHLATYCEEHHQEERMVELLLIELGIWTGLGEKRYCAQAAQKIGEVCHKQDNLTGADQYLTKALELYKLLADQEKSAMVCLELAEISRAQGIAPAAYKRASEAKNIFEQLGNELGMAEALNVLGWISNDLGMYKEAETFCLEALTLNTSHSRHDRIAHDNLLLGEIAIQRNLWTKAEDLLKSALRTFREGNDLSNMGNCYICLAEVLLRLGRDRRGAAALLMRAKDCFQRSHDKHGLKQVEKYLREIADSLAYAERFLKR